MADVHADAVATLASWIGSSPSQRALAQAYLGFLQARSDACARSCPPGHLTASAVVFDHELRHVALVLHRIVGAWLAPGGHLEPSDASLVEAARREVWEETGLEVVLDPVPVSLDCHPITCRGAHGRTRHFDVRFAARALPGAPLRVSAESHDVRWWPVDALPEVFPEVAELVAAGRTRLVASD